MNESGCITGDTLFAVYSKFSTIIATKREEKGKEDNTHEVIADGHKNIVKNIPWINSFSGLILLVQRRSTTRLILSCI